jgi:hypothetical protein
MRTRTNREMLRDVTRAAPPLAAPFERLTGDFERAWYGHADPGSDGFERARSSYEHVVEGAPATAAAEPVTALATPPAKPAAHNGDSMGGDA